MRGDNRYKTKPTLIVRMAVLERFKESDTVQQMKRDARPNKLRGFGYHKGGAGIEKNPNSKRKPTDNYNLRKVKGKMPYKGLVREKSKYEISNPFTGRD